MASPAVRSSNPTADSSTGGCFTAGSTAGTNHNAVLPATIESGDVLIIAGRVSGAGTVGFPAGWTVTQDSSDGSDDVTFWAYKNAVADGSEDGTNVNVTHGNFKITGHSLAISGAISPGTQAPQTSTVAVGTNATPDPGSISPTGGSKDYLFLWFGAWDGEQTLNKTAPTNYTDLHDVSTSTASTVNHQQKMAYRQLTAASEDPGTITISAAPLGWTAWTIAVHPAGAATHSGASTLGLVFGASSGSLAKKFAASTLPLVFGFISNGARKVLTASTHTHVFGFTSNGIREVYAASSLPLVFGFTSNGVATPGGGGPVTHFGASTLGLIFGVSTSSSRSTFASSSQTFTFGVATGARRSTFGGSTLPLAFGVSTSARVKAIGRSTLPVVFSFTSNGIGSGEIVAASAIVVSNIPAPADVTAPVGTTAGIETDGQVTTSTAELSQIVTDIEEAGATATVADLSP